MGSIPIGRPKVVYKSDVRFWYKFRVSIYLIKSKSGQAQTPMGHFGRPKFSKTYLDGLCKLDNRIIEFLRSAAYRRLTYARSNVWESGLLS